MLPCMKRHVTENFQKASKLHLKFKIQQCFWDSRDEEGFKSKVELASKPLFESLIAKDTAVTESEITNFAGSRVCRPGRRR